MDYSAPIGGSQPVDDMQVDRLEVHLRVLPAVRARRVRGDADGVGLLLKVRDLGRLRGDCSLLTADSALQTLDRALQRGDGGILLRFGQCKSRGERQSEECARKSEHNNKACEHGSILST